MSQQQDLPPGVSLRDVSPDEPPQIDAPCLGQCYEVPDSLKCTEISPDTLYLCDGQKKHKGDHFACIGDKHNVFTWPNE